MAAQQLSRETIADELGYSSKEALALWFKAADSGSSSQVREIDARVQEFFEAEGGKEDEQGPDDDDDDEEESGSGSGSGSGEEESDSEEGDFVTCDGPCGCRLTGADVVFTDGSVEYCERCYPGLGRELTQTTAAACLDEVAREGDEEGQQSDGEAAKQGEAVVVEEVHVVQEGLAYGVQSQVQYVELAGGETGKCDDDDGLLIEEID